MSQALIGLNNTHSQMMARQRIEASINLKKLYADIDADPAIVGAGVVYIDADFNVVTLREFTPLCSLRPKRIILREAKPYIAPAQFVQQVQNNPRESRLLYEAVSTTLACSGAVLGWIAVIGGSVTVPFTGGASLAITAIGAASLGAGTLQCANGLYRVKNELLSPEINDQLDSKEWYTTTLDVLDVAALLGVAATGATAARLLHMRKTMTGRSFNQSLQNLNRQERKRLTEELLALRHPDLTPRLIKLQQRSGVLPKRYPATEISAAFRIKLSETLGMGVGLAGSSRVQKSIAVGLYEELPE
ncbi:NAD synthetase [Pseudomonas sp. LJDD11]|uniref:NAD synthetase n=1 Tax=Pseudomonas sp. LJDD11 TaxID=2931984 RepID=UPI00211C9B8A|nr:NAD synthetase [Pseudomonas sp. LJDD11]MCQ9427290.1 NAD synthetase [Pseudomonas sp. LJDD11]